mgnify:FL=1
MINVIIAFLVVIPLIPLNDVLLLWANREPTKALGIASIMFGLNLVIILTYGFLLKPDEPKGFILGLLAAILTIMIRKIKKLMK